MNHLYWQSATWIAILTFPVFLLTFSLAQPLTEILFTESYHDSGTLLAILSLGYYVQAAFGFNGTTLVTYRCVRYIAVMNIGVALFSITMGLLLIPIYGSLGAAISTCSTIVLHNILKQIGLLLYTDVSLIDRRYVRVYLTIAVGAGTMLLLQLLTDLSVYISVVIAGLVFVGTLRMNRDLLDVEKTFPELLRLPLLARLLGRTR